MERGGGDLSRKIWLCLCLSVDCFATCHTYCELASSATKFCQASSAGCVCGVGCWSWHTVASRHKILCRDATVVLFLSVNASCHSQHPSVVVVHAHMHVAVPLCLQWLFCWQSLTYLLTTLLVFVSILPSLSTLSCLTASALCHSQYATHPSADTTTVHISPVLWMRSANSFLRFFSLLLLSLLSFSLHFLYLFISLFLSHKHLYLCESLRVFPC